jgi:hypothetical protein
MLFSSLLQNKSGKRCWPRLVAAVQSPKGDQGAQRCALSISAQTLAVSFANFRLTTGRQLLCSPFLKHPHLAMPPQTRQKPQHPSSIRQASPCTLEAESLVFFPSTFTVWAHFVPKSLQIKVFAGMLPPCVGRHHLASRCYKNPLHVSSEFLHLRVWFILPGPQTRNFL